MNEVFSYDERRDLAIFSGKSEVLDFTAEMLALAAKAAIEKKGVFTLALSGGSTPKELYEKLAHEYANRLDWSKVVVFFGDERAVTPDSPGSNYRMALDAGFKKLPLRAMHRMVAEENIEENAHAYEQVLIKELGEGAHLDFVLLGLGEDGHTASLFPKTHALHAQERWCVPNFVPKLDAWRMTLTMPFINAADTKIVLALGASKKEAVKKVLELQAPYDEMPTVDVGSEIKKALFVLDMESAALLLKEL